jgi:hypothetical protein
MLANVCATQPNAVVFSGSLQSMASDVVASTTDATSLQAAIARSAPIRRVYASVDHPSLPLTFLALLGTDARRRELLADQDVVTALGLPPFWYTPLPGSDPLVVVDQLCR